MKTREELIKISELKNKKRKLNDYTVALIDIIEKRLEENTYKSGLIKGTASISKEHFKSLKYQLKLNFKADKKLVRKELDKYFQKQGYKTFTRDNKFRKGKVYIVTYHD